MSATTTWMKENQFGYTLVNFPHVMHIGEKLKHDPYILSSQVDLVIYIQDPKKCQLKSCHESKA